MRILGVVPRLRDQVLDKDTEYRADLVVLLVNGAPVLGIVIEVQLTPKLRKRFTWPLVRAVSEDRLVLYSDLIAAALSEAARKALVMLPQGYEYQSDIVRESIQKGIAQGTAQGRAADVLEVLDARGLAVSDADRDRVLGCTDLELLGRWLRRAVTVAASDALFE